LSSPHNSIPESVPAPLLDARRDGLPEVPSVVPPLVEDPPWTGWDVAALMGLALVAIFACVLGTALLLHSRSPIVLVIGQAVGYVCLILTMYLMAESRSSGHALQVLRWNWPHHWQTYVLAGVGLHLLLAPFEFLLPMPKHLPVDEFFKTARDAYILAAFGILFAPLLEELVFRGFLYPVLARRLGMRPSILLTTIFFAGIHTPQLSYHWAPVLIIFMVGLVLTTIRALKKSVACTVLMHMAYNSTIFALAFVGTGGFRHMEKFNP
jgi:uncharacterized protein